MRACLVLSPHYDDAVLSVGQFLAGRPEVMVATVFAGYPTDNQKTQYDADCGFENAFVAIGNRGIENYAALQKLKAYGVDWPFVDSQYGVKTEVASVAKNIIELVNRIKPEFVVAPLGLLHPDHVLVSDAAIQASKRFKCPLYLYSELPYRVMWPEVELDRIAELDIKPQFIGDGSLEKKEAAIKAYGSQLWSLNLHACLVPERTWLVS